MATLYTTKLPTPDALPAGLEVRVTVMRKGGGELTRAELEAAAALYPPPAKHRAEFKRALDAAPVSSPAKASRRDGATGGASKAAKPRAASGSSTAPKASKRAAAKRPR
ncbi:MAG: hypothetical protein Q8S73_36460 [Deltaproteobacteria bacterium]|nr:hypothetical protein [Myxococcales bacterium]MDP3219652.1 hypothetical protein [Deltaproteobacteria bacterium]